MDLLLEAVGEGVGDVGSLTVGELRGDLIAVGAHLAELLASEPMGSVVASIIVESRREPSLDDLRKRLIAQRRIVAERVIGDGVARGELPPDTDTGALATDFAAQILFRSLVLRAPIDAAWVEGHVDRLLRLHRGEE